MKRQQQLAPSQPQCRSTPGQHLVGAPVALCCDGARLSLLSRSLSSQSCSSVWAPSIHPTLSTQTAYHTRPPFRLRRFPWSSPAAQSVSLRCLASSSSPALPPSLAVIQLPSPTAAPPGDEEAPPARPLAAAAPLTAQLQTSTLRPTTSPHRHRSSQNLTATARRLATPPVGLSALPDR